MANNPYVNKVVYGDQTVMDISDTDATSADVISGKKFYLGSGAPATGTASLDDKMKYADNSILGAASIVDFSKTTVVNADTTSVEFVNNGFTVESITDGTYRASKTLVENLIARQRYKLLFDVTALSNTGNRVATRNSSNVVQESLSFSATGSYEFEFTWDEGFYLSFFATYSTSTSGSLTVDNVQVRLISDTDKTYQPYTMTNKNLTEKIKLLGSASTKDVPTSGDAGSTEVVLGNDSRLTNARTPTSHTHTTSDVTDFPTLATVATSGAYNDLSGKPQTTTTVTYANSALVTSGGVYDALPHIITRTVTASAYTDVRFPASGTSDLISSGGLCTIYSVCEPDLNGKVIKHSSITIHDGYVNIKYAQDLSNNLVGIMIIDPET